MRNSMTAVLERNGITGPVFTTEPYEVAWAGEARWFIRTLELPAPAQRVDVTVQVSPDGLHWTDADGEVRSIAEPGLTTWTSHEFGGWLRLRATVVAEDAADVTIPALVYLALKA
ncbi:hypothetical protein KZZ52_17465 [Dactylosporangium sp. AC04546]|uniref:hypothetical protein n=1 Tax=Dactylosporangium sp. AC04546 TaxID=2862460 RepID=UPI002E7B5953|nr:hypothetical protein [Dactylosporangium sp. AC04546]WVK87087.1 hypothetical protein KZZ52_17465 [Dactylosporangium sp. AC04546]